MGTDGRGALSHCGIAQGSTWNTAVTCGADTGFLLENEGLVGGPEVIPDRGVRKKAFGNPPVLGHESHRGPLSLLWRYGGNVPLFIAGIMGVAGAPAGASPYQHTVQFMNRLSKFFTICMAKGDVKLWEYASVWFTRMVLRVGGRDPATLEVEGLASTMLNDDSGVNDLATFVGAVTLPSEAEEGPIDPVFMGDLRFRINAYGGDALDSGDDVTDITEFELTIDRKGQEEFKSAAAPGRYMSLPTEGEDVDVTLRVVVPEYIASTYRDYVDDQTYLKAEAYFKGPLISGSDYYEYTFSFPYLIGVDRPENAIAGPQRIADGITFKCLEPDAAPTGMTTVKPFELEVQNQRSTAYIT